jgi:hypothetical protein
MAMATVEETSPSQPISPTKTENGQRIGRKMCQFCPKKLSKYTEKVEESQEKIRNGSHAL